MNGKAKAKAPTRWQPPKAKPIELPKPQALPGDTEDAAKRQRWQQMAATRSINYPEYVAYEWLVLTKQLQEGKDFYFRPKFLSGGTRLGGYEPNFYFPAKQMVWFIVTSRRAAWEALVSAAVSGRGLAAVWLVSERLASEGASILTRAWAGKS